jgi:hypothetical protein
MTASHHQETFAEQPVLTLLKTLYDADELSSAQRTKIMTATSTSRMVVPFVAFVAAFGLALVFAIQHVRREPPVDIKAATAAPAISKPASDG